VVAEAGLPGAGYHCNEMADVVRILNSDPAEGTGGLAIIGTERHESRRVIDSCRGRAVARVSVLLAEQQFYSALADDLIRVFGSERMHRLRIRWVIRRRSDPHSMVTKVLREPEKVEENNFGIRQTSLDLMT